MSSSAPQQVSSSSSAGATTAEAEKRLTDAEVEQLIDASLAARLNSYSPYSKFSVGAALLTPDGTIVGGCNVENISYGLTICAERNAICRAVADGHRKFRAIAITAEMGERFVGPCGACRQFLAEFGLDWEVYLAMPSKQYMKTTVAKLIPDSFSPEWVNLDQRQVG
ncbi:cytidine deaminase-like isoform X2 [Eriocheir sinensis]|uniref:cytidine deaminase-like isoform X2 n=1 Tax=Eriocheir sinensis TaxID=95602 RepID=UPI0021C5892C|nr:cytidine deaminase-like isoform X2 [Eriocheir sinensis]